MNATEKTNNPGLIPRAEDLKDARKELTFDEASVLLKTIDDDDIALDYLDYMIERWPKEMGIPPCQYTVEELREGVIKAAEDIRDGRGIHNDEIWKQYEKWL